MLGQLKKISLISVGNIFNALLGVLFLTAVARSVSVEEFGKYALLTTLLVSMSKVIDFGSNSIFVAQETKKEAEYINSFLTLKILMLFVAMLLGITALVFLGLNNQSFFVLYILGIIAYSLNITFFSIFQKFQMYDYAVFLNTIPAIIKGTLGTMVFFNLLTINLTQAYSIFSLAMFSCIVFIVKIPAKYKKFHLDFTKTKELALLGAPGGIALLIQHSWPTISNTIAKVSQSFAAAGIFSIAEKIANIFTLISVSVFTVLLPENAERKYQDKKYDFKGTFIISILIIILGIGAIIAGTFLLPIIFGDKYQESIALLWILIIASCLTAIHTFLDNYFYVNQNIKPIMYINLVKLFVMVGLGFYLIGIFGLAGLAFAQLVSATIALFLTFLLIKRNIKT